MRNELTVLILTYNESPNIGRTLERLKWAKDILVVDSFSGDETLDIVEKFANVRVLQRKFDDHTTQWNFGLDHCSTDWVLALDADYIVPESFNEELKKLSEASNVVAYSAHFRYCINGHPLRGTLYPPHPVLFHKTACRYVADGHTQRLQVNGSTEFLSSVIDHDDRKSLSRWLWAQDRYAILEAEKLASISSGALGIQDRIRKKVILAPMLVLVFTAFCKGLILDGWPGWYYIFQRTLAEIMLSLRLMEARFIHSTKH